MRVVNWMWIVGAAVLVVVPPALVLGRRRKAEARAKQHIADLVDRQRALRDEAHEALDAYRAARGNEADLARARLLRVPDEADANAWALTTAGASEQQVATARRVADEIRMFLTTAISLDPYC